MGSRIQLGFSNTGGAVSPLCCKWGPCCITLPQGTWICGFPMPGRGCGVKYNPTPCLHQLSLFSVGEKRKVLCENQNLNAAKKKSQIRGQDHGEKELEVTGEPRAGGAGPAGWTDTQTSLCHGPGLSSCPALCSRANFSLWEG